MLYSAWGSDNDVWRLQAFKQVDLVLDGLPSVNNLCSYIWKIFCESSELVLNLISELSSVTKDKSRKWFRVVWQLMKNS